LASDSQSHRTFSASTSLSTDGERPSTSLRTALSERSESNGRSRTIRCGHDVEVLCGCLPAGRQVFPEDLEEAAEMLAKR
jgi:hypothetical protein